jgi:Uma2 family endonuclease
MAMQAAPLHFPEFGEVPESKRHLKVRTLLFELLELAFADRAAIGSDQFVYWDPTNPRVCLAPDAFVKLDQPNDLFGSWKTWQRGVPELGVEVVSDFDDPDREWNQKLTRFNELGVLELVRFDPRLEPPRLQIWDRRDGSLIERDLAQQGAQSLVLPGFWCAVSDAKIGPTLRLSRDPYGADLYLTEAEQLRQIKNG